jgi:hypothetical protein
MVSYLNFSQAKARFSVRATKWGLTVLYPTIFLNLLVPQYLLNAVEQVMTAHRLTVPEIFRELFVPDVLLIY